MGRRRFTHDNVTYEIWFEAGLQFACQIVGAPYSDDFTYVLKSYAAASFNEAKLRKALGL